MADGNAISLAAATSSHGSSHFLRTKRKAAMKLVKKHIISPVQDVFRTPIHERILRRKPPPLKANTEPEIEAVPVPPPFQHNEAGPLPRRAASIVKQDAAPSRQDSGVVQKRSPKSSSNYDEAQQSASSRRTSTEERDNDAGSSDSELQYYRSALADKRVTLLRGSSS